MEKLRSISHSGLAFGSVLPPPGRTADSSAAAISKRGFFSIGGNRKGKGEKERKERKKERRKGRKKRKKKEKRKEKKKKKEKKRREKKEKKKKEEKRRKERRERKIRKKVKRFGKLGTKKLGFPRIREDTRAERFFY